MLPLHPTDHIDNPECARWTAAYAPVPWPKAAFRPYEVTILKPDSGSEGERIRKREGTPHPAMDSRGATGGLHP